MTTKGGLQIANFVVPIGISFIASYIVAGWVVVVVCRILLYMFPLSQQFSTSPSPLSLSLLSWTELLFFSRRLFSFLTANHLSWQLFLICSCFHDRQLFSLPIAFLPFNRCSLSWSVFSLLISAISLDRCSLSWSLLAFLSLDNCYRLKAVISL